MNIHLTEAEFNELNKRVILTVRVGSELYGLNNKKSDSDLLSIYAAPVDNLHSLVQTHHQFQYKSNNTDYLLCSLQSFVRNIILGDSPLNFEALDSEAIRNHEDLSFLYNFRSNLNNYQLIKGYLGLARRDLKMFKKDKSSKKMFHCLRGFLTAKTLFGGKEYNNDFSSFTDQERLTLKLIKNDELPVVDLGVLADELSFKIDSFRKDLNEKLENNKIEKVMSLDKLSELDNWLINVSKKYAQSGRFQNMQFLNSIQSDIEYNR